MEMELRTCVDKLERGGEAGGGAANNQADGKGEVWRGLDLELQLHVSCSMLPHVSLWYS